MQLIDWILVALSMLLVIGITFYSHRFTHSVVDFLSGGRCAGRYLLAVASNSGVIVFVAIFELISKSGFVLNWWNYITPFVGLVVGIYGFVTYRMRETRVLTLAQFFEVRYSKSFRVFSGILGAISGLACDGIIAAIEARFFVYFLGLPELITVGGVTLDTFVVLMAVFLSIAMFITLFGGFVAIMVIDCLEGILSQLFFLFIIFTLLSMFSWTQITTALGNTAPGESMFNPFDALKVSDFNIWFTLMSICVAIYGTGAWRNSNGYSSAPVNAHEGRMAAILGRWRDTGKGEAILLLGICGMTFMVHPDFAAPAALVREQLSKISQPYIQQQMTIPVAMTHFLAAGCKGGLCLVFLMGMVSGTGSRCQSWASILVQDVVVPLRKKPIPTHQHLFILKATILGVALFFFVFGALFRQTQYIIMWFTVTSAIYLGGAGSVIIGGLYWKKGTTAAAWGSMITGSVLAVSGILACEIYQKAFPLNGQQVAFIACLISITVFIVVSLLTCREDFDMDRMLHRGKYAAAKKLLGEEIQEYQTKSRLLRWIGVDKDFSRGDKWIAGSLFAWMLFWFVVFIVGTIWNRISPWPLHVWMTYWHITAIVIPVTIATVTAVWFSWGGTLDIFRLFRRLKLEKANALDNGSVVGHHNAAELVLEDKIAQKKDEKITHC